MRKFKEKHPILYRAVTLADFRECLNEYVKETGPWMVISDFVVAMMTAFAVSKLLG